MIQRRWARVGIIEPQPKSVIKNTVSLASLKAFFYRFLQRTERGKLSTLYMIVVPIYCLFILLPQVFNSL